jgi:hypothetical protein
MPRFPKNRGILNCAARPAGGSTKSAIHRLPQKSDKTESGVSLKGRASLGKCAAIRGSRKGEPMMESAKRMHKFELGQSASLQSTLFNRDAASGAYKVTKQLSERDGEFEYQVKRPGEPHERVVKERDLSAE